MREGQTNNNSLFSFGKNMPLNNFADNGNGRNFTPNGIFMFVFPSLWFGMQGVPFKCIYFSLTLNTFEKVKNNDSI